MSDAHHGFILGSIVGLDLALALIVLRYWFAEVWRTRHPIHLTHCGPPADGGYESISSEPSR